MLYRHLHHHNDTINKQTQEDFFNKIFTSHFIARVRKGLLEVCAWEGAGDRKETAIFWSSLLWPSRCVFLVLQMLNRRSRGPLWMASFTAWLPLLHLISNFSGPQTPSGVPEGPLGRVWLSLPHLVLLRLELELALNWVI